MKRSQIENVVGRIESEIGPDASPGAIELRAVAELQALAGRRRRGQPQNPTEAVLQSAQQSAGQAGNPAPACVTVRLSLKGCASRRPPTVLAHAYDRIRRLSSGLPRILSGTLQISGQPETEIRLAVHGLAELVEGFSSGETLQICRAVEQAALDAGFHRIELLSLSAGKGGSSERSMPLVPRLLASCSRSHVDIELANSRVGLRCEPLYSLAQLYGSELSDPDLALRLSCSSNASTRPDPFQNRRTDRIIDLSVSVAPRLWALAGEMPADACYRDRFDLLAAVGRTTARDAASLQRLLLDSAGMGSNSDAAGAVELSVDGSLDAVSVVTGLPNATAAGMEPAAAMLQTGLLAATPRNADIRLASDGLELSVSVRNLFLYPPGEEPARIAGALAERLSHAVSNGSRIWTRCVAETGPETGSGIRGGNPPLSPARLSPNGSWSSAHFLRGGALIPPRVFSEFA